MMYVVLSWSCRKAVMRLPGLEAPEGGNICGIYGVPVGLRCWYCYCCLGDFRLGCPFWDFLLLFVLLWPVVIPVSLRWFFGLCCVRKWSWQFWCALWFGGGLAECVCCLERCVLDWYNLSLHKFSIAQRGWINSRLPSQVWMGRQWCLGNTTIMVSG